MVWKGVIVEESLKDKSLLKLVRIIDTEKEKLEGEDRVMIFHKIEVEDNKKDEFVEKAIKAIKKGFYIHLVKDKVMYVLFKGVMYRFSRGSPELEEARKHGKSIGIPEEQMPFEHLIEEPWD